MRKPAIGVLAASIASVSWAQDQDLNEQQGAQTGGLEEIVVTATRREANLQEVPVSIVAITGDNLEMRGLDSLEDVSQAVPNVLITGGGGGTSNTSFRVRGIPNVGTYVDGVWQVGTGGFLTQELVEIDRIEVLRGPQGTMFGRDSTGGALRIWTKRPSEEFGGNVTATVGSLDRRDVKVALDLPLSENLLTKWTAASLYRDGYIRSLTTNENHGGIDQTVLRGDILWRPTDRLNVRFNYQDNDSQFTEPRVQDAIYDTYDQFRLQAAVPEFYGLAGAEPFTRETQLAGYPGGKVGKWENRSDITLPNHYVTEQTTVDIHWDITDSVQVQFLTAKTEQDGDQYVDWDSSQYALVNDLNRSRLDVFSQEIQFTGDGDRISWVAGLYYWDQETITRNARWLIEEFRLGQLDPNAIFAHPQCTAPTPPGFSDCQTVYAGATGPGPSGPYDTFGFAEQDGWAVFGEVTVNLTNTLDLTVGVRQHDQSGDNYTLYPIPGVTAPKPETVNMLHSGGDPFVGTPINPSTGEHSPRNPFQFDKLTSRFALQNQFTDDLMGYISYSEGFNSGGVSVATISNVRTFFPYEPSTLKNYEVGMRSDWADGRVRFNATVFHTVWEDIQAFGAVTDPNTGTQLPTLLITNVGEAEAEGAEFELTFVPVESLLINVNLGLLDTAYTKLRPGQMSGHLPWTTDTEFQQAPETTYSIGFQHTATLAGGATWTTRLDYNYQDQFWRSEPFLRLSGYDGIPPNEDESGDSAFLNLRFTYEPPDRRWQFSIFGTNLTDEYLINSGFFHGIWGFDFATVARPREAGASLTFRFE
ncbi:MAG TPA: TonB-dependent receptor [Gammaproteobacteria bacterium]